MESEMIIIFLLIILIAIYIYDIYKREKFSNFYTPANYGINSIYSPVDYNTRYDNCQNDTGYPLDRPCRIKTNIPKRKNVCNKNLEVIDINSDYNSLLSLNSTNKNNIMDNLSLNRKNIPVNDYTENVDIKSLNSMDSFPNTLNDVNEDLNSFI